MRLSLFPSSSLALLALTAPPMNFASAAVVDVDVDADASVDHHESVIRHSQWLSDKFGLDLHQQSQSQSQFQNTRRDETETKTETESFVTDPLGTQFTMAEMDELEEEIRFFDAAKNANANAIQTTEELFSPKHVFMTQCVSNILSQGDDGLISQNDATQFLVDFCVDIGACEPGYTTIFQALDHKLQLSFTRFNCPFRSDGPQDQQCLDELGDQGAEFGYVISPDEDMAVLEDKVTDMCENFWRFGADFHGGTDSPTPLPSTSPSVSPSMTPSVSPTWLPSNVPTGMPSTVPTSSPSSLPTFVPSAEPSSGPTGMPTLTPSSSPSGSPTLTPSSSPSSLPTWRPSTSPSSLPTLTPSASPTDAPSSSPSSLPTLTPSTSPSSLPTLTPSASPTDVPSVSPSTSPTAIPSPSPTVSQLPTLAPTQKPSFVGSWHPSVSSKPSHVPTSSPSSSPTTHPTLMPSSSPSSSPSGSPSSSPTTLPTLVPSMDPSSSPTTMPSSSPSGSPSSSPTTLPTFVPSMDPSSSPTTMPSSSPSGTPSTSPSTSPTSQPSVSPSDTPTALPSTSPTSQPSVSPSDAPTQIPSLSPTMTELPTSEPSSHPSFMGSWHPSASVAPTSMPTSSPSASPSDLPSSSPSASPSGLPSASPSGLPTGTPSSLPSSTPSSSPSGLPSTSPSGLPTGTPSSLPSGTPSSLPSASPSDLPTGTPSSLPSGAPSSLPTVLPSSVPSMRPSSLPSLEPSHRPTLPPGVSMAPSSTPTSTPSVTPTFSQAPTRTQLPSSSPTQTVPFRVDFTYIAGFNSTAISKRTLDDANQDVAIMDDIRKTIREVLALDDITRRRQLQSQLGSGSQLDLDLDVSVRSRVLIGFRGQGDGAVYHKDLIDEDACPASFTESVSCVRVVTEVIVFANNDTYTAKQVENSVRNPVKESMEDNVFVEFMDMKALREVKYVGAGNVIDDPIDPDGNDRNPILSSGGVAGIAVGAIFLAAAIALFAVTRSRADDDREEPPEVQSSDESYNSDLDPEIEIPAGGTKGLVVEEGTEKDPLMDALDSTRAHQIDIETGATIIPAVMSSGANDNDNDSDGSSNYSSDEESDILIGRLDAAVSAGDWAAVAAIAGDLSTGDEASSMSSVNTSKYSNTRDRDGLDSANAKRAATIDQLITEGDWNAVGATAAAFDDGSSSGASSSMKSEKSSGISSKNISSNDGTKKSIIDFIAGPWQSSAASKAMINDHDHDHDDANVDVLNQSDAISSLSGGISPERLKDPDLELGATSFQPLIHHISESDTTDDDTRPMLGNGKKEKKGWKGRIPIIRRKHDAAEKTAAKSLALQEDSSVSSWSQGSPESNVYTPYSAAKPKAAADMPEEMKAFGEDFGLAAAELAMRQEEEAKENADDNDKNSSNGAKSQKSSNSLRDELDRAIETGDWEAVEAQTNKLFDVSMDDLEDAPRKRSHHSCDSYDSDGDNSREGWSTTSKSMASGNSAPIDDERIAMLEKLIETDDWQGIVSSSQLHNSEDSSMASSIRDDDSEVPDSLLSPRESDDTDEEKSIYTLP